MIFDIMKIFYGTEYVGEFKMRPLYDNICGSSVVMCNLCGGNVTQLILLNYLKNSQKKRQKGNFMNKFERHHA